MDDFADKFDQPEIDPAAEFLAREQNQLAGLEEELESIQPPPVVPTTPAFVADYSGVVDTETNIFEEETVSIPVIEPEKIRIWREEQKKRLDQKDEEEERCREEMRKAAKKELDDWYKNHEEQIAKTKAANRNAERALADAIEGGDGQGGEWERVAGLCDFGPRRGRDVSRLRSIMLQLKQAGVRPYHPQPLLA